MNSYSPLDAFITFFANFFIKSEMLLYKLSANKNTSCSTNEICFLNEKDHTF